MATLLVPHRRSRDMLTDESEKHFMGRVRRRADLLGWKVWHQNDSIGTRAGLPDLIMVRPPRLIFAELKSEYGRLSAAQRDAIADLLRCPQVEAYVWRPSDMGAIQEVLAW